MILLATDVAPSQALRKLSGALLKLGHEANLYVGDGKTVPDGSTLNLSDVEAVVVGMSSTATSAQPEIALATRAKTAGVPVYLYADTFGVHNRPGFGEILPGSTLFHISEAEAEAARNTFPETQVVATGNPMAEGFFFPKYNRAQVREKLGIQNDEIKVVLCPGGKSALINLIHFGRVVEDLQHMKNVIIFLSPHQSDTTNVSVYQELCDLSFLPIQLVPCRLLLSASDMLVGMDMVFESASTIGIEAACQRIPVVTYLSPFARKRLHEGTGKATWPLADQGVVYDYGAFESPARSLDYILKTGACRNLDILDRLYPKPERKGIALEKMIDAITSVLVAA